MCAAASASATLMASLSATGEDIASGLKCSCGVCRSPLMLQRVFRDIGLPLASRFVLRTVLSGSSLVPGGSSDLGMYVIVPRASRLSSSAFHDSAHSALSGSLRACARLRGSVNVDGVLAGIAVAVCACVCAWGSEFGSYCLKSAVRHRDTVSLFLS